MDAMTMADIDAEQAALGSMLMSAAAIEAVTEIAAPRDFFRPAHQIIASCIVAMHAAAEPVDPITVAAELGRSGELAKTGELLYLHTLYASAPTAANGPWYARIVADHAIRRRIAEVGTRMVQRAGETGQEPGDVLAAAQSDLAGAVSYSETGSTGLMDVDEFCGLRFDRAEPIIPGLLYAGERVIVVAGEGMGKSTLARQIAVMTGAGLHPFTGDVIPPKRALYIDLENPPRLVQSKMRPLRDLASQQPGWNPRRVQIWAKPGGVDVRSAADQQLLTQVIRAAEPDLILAGPLYKMTVDQGERAEQLHGAVAAFWDRIREQTGAALWLEAHAPMAQSGMPRDFRPLGSGIWQRWPEFGVSLRLIDRGDLSGGLALGRFRGDRDERQWPDKLVRTPWGDPWRWPWQGIYPPGTFRSRSAIEAA